MPRKKKEKIEGIEDKLEYLGLELDNIPKKLKEFEPLEFRVSRFYDEKQYRQYRYIPIQDLQILLSPTNRLEELGEKYKKASPLYEYLDNEKEENILKYTTFLNMLKNFNIEDVENVEKEQNNLNREIPFKIKYQGNYLWQIYYSENTDKYFMIVPTEDTDYSTFFYILKKKIENKKNAKIFVPVSNVKYSNKFWTKSAFEDMENYLWMFTKDWPLIYEVYDKNEELSIQIIGETNVYGKIKTPYKIELKTAKEANEFYKLVKALFILQTELPHYFNFTTNIDENCSLEFYLEDQKIQYKYMTSFIRDQYKVALKSRKEIRSKIRFYKKKLEELKQIAAEQDIEYIAKEKQISTFLECKKSFFGKVKYFFKYSKKSNKVRKEAEEQEYEEIEENNQEELPKAMQEAKKEKKKIPIKKVYTLEELIENYKELEKLETEMKNLLMDVNALKLKNKNMEKKIQNAAKFIEEIDSHKKSIFEFWKYSNKDEMAVLPEGELEEVNVIKRIEKMFDYEEDFEELGKKLDRMQRKNLSKEEIDATFIASTNVVGILNKIKINDIMPEDIEKSLKEIKKEAIDEKSLAEEYDIFGNLIEDNIKVKKIKNKKHRELPRDKYNILDVNKNTKQIGYKLTLQSIIKNVTSALEKGVIPENLPVYKAVLDDKLNNKEINVFNINPEEEIKDAMIEDGNKINLYKINVKEGTNGVAFTNIIFYDNQNKTLPLGMDLSTKLILNTAKLHLNLLSKKTFKVAKLEDEKDDFSEVLVKDVEVYEYEIVVFDEEVEKKEKTRTRKSK
ncbi:MAG: hypothetical protein BHW00_06120 [Clostridium sp. 26_22]|nr:MAG: hypothetical protein BHW00_06120 [Clostridium sp. 26_22]